ncbi:patatin-like phospholipase family protein, partial [Acidithiobacillus sp. MC6.1]|nr:patatin-like phospholipase family protein [Acidithiobacillus sp. MC6.1]
DRAIRKHLGGLYGPRRLEEARIPVCVIATDLESGLPVVMDAGPAIQAVRASISIPGLFPAVNHAGKRLVDGAICMPLPIAVARSLYP